jgi:hypothetical protein
VCTTIFPVGVVLKARRLTPSGGRRGKDIPGGAAPGAVAEHWEPKQAEGIEVADPPTQDGPDLNGVGRLWVSVETGLPVRIELEQRAQERVAWVLDFRWGEQVDADAFRPNVPEGFDQVPFEGWSAAPGDRGDGGG